MHPACQLNASFDEDIKGWEGKYNPIPVAMVEDQY